MKNHFLIFFLILLFSSYSCKKSENISLKENEVLVQNEKCTVERLNTQSKEFNFLIENFSQSELKSAEVSQLDFEDILKYTHSNSKLKYYFFSISGNSTQYILALQNDKDLTFMKITLSAFDGIKTFSIESLSNDNLLTIYLNNEDEVLDAEKNIANPLYTEIKKLMSTPTLTLKNAVAPTCDEKTDNYVDCIECSVREFMSDYLSMIACGLYPGMCLTAAAIHCL